MSEEGGVILPQAFVQSAGAEICMQASRLQRIVKAWVDASLQNRPGNTDAVLMAISGTLGTLESYRDQIVFVREREGKKVTSA